jgi:hypothetical protein
MQKVKDMAVMQKVCCILSLTLTTDERLELRIKNVVRRQITHVSKSSV